MEIVEYLCEFFFCNFWHWLGLLFIVAIICGTSLVRVVTNDNNEKEK